MARRSEVGGKTTAILLTFEPKGKQFLTGCDFLSKMRLKLCRVISGLIILYNMKIGYLHNTEVVVGLFCFIDFIE